MDTKLNKRQSQNGTESIVIENIPKEKPFGTCTIEPNPGRKNQDSYKENNEAHHCPRIREIAKTTYQPVCSQHCKVLQRSNCGSMVSWDSTEYNVMKKEISGLKRVQQQLFKSLSAMTEKRDHYKQEANSSKIDADCAHLDPYSSASKVS